MSGYTTQDENNFSEEKDGMSHQIDQFQCSSSPFPALTKSFPAAGKQDRSLLSDVAAALAYLEAVRQRPALLYMAEDQEPHHKPLEESDIALFYDALRSLGPLEHLDLVLNTTGGNVTTVRKLLHVLHAMVSHLTILVPYKACSAGTLLCLGAHDLVMTSIAELSPIDPQLQGMQGENSSHHSSADVVLFRDMARDWFGVNCQNPDHALSVLHLFCQKIFPPSLTRFYRAEQLVRQVAQEALRFQLPDASVEMHNRIIEYLITGYADHQYPINSKDLLHLGLNMIPPSIEEEQAIWALWQRSRAYLNASGETAQVDRVNGLLLGAHFAARHRLYALLDEPQNEPQAGESVTRYLLSPRWERLEL
jgi:ATP-dependent protease ClpP protease subunit